ncbi:MAG: hypothetical protein ACTSU2_09575, partial [Promethearchaeota archaeon]
YSQLKKFGISDKPIGQAGFIYLSLFHFQRRKIIRDNLKKRNLVFKLILRSNDFAPDVLLYFTPYEIKTYSMPTTPSGANEDIHNFKYDAMMIADSETFVNYFIGRYGAIMPILTGKVKVKKMLKVMKLLWFIKEMHKYFKDNLPYAMGVYKTLYKYYKNLEKTR